MQELFVGEGFEEGLEIGALLRRERKAGDELGFVGILAAVACVGASCNDASAVGVVIEDVVESAQAAVVHVWAADGNIAQRGRAELADIGEIVGELV